MKSKWSAQWIWCVQNDIHEYNQTVLFRKEFNLDEPGSAVLRISADSWYRIFINGKWVHDGPAKAYPNHYLFDTLMVGDLLKEGKNRIDVIVRYYGVGTMHQIPLQAGLIAQIDAGGKCIATDSSWMASPSTAWKQWAPKVSIQMEAVEEYDARCEKVLDWQPAVEAKRPGRIRPRNVGLLTKIPRRPRALHSATVVKRGAEKFCVPITQIAHPDLIEGNGYTSRPVLLTSTWTVRKKQQFDFSQAGQKGDFLNPGAKNWQICVNGRVLKSGKITLGPGKHLVVFFCASFYGHEKVFPFPYLNMPGGRWGAWKTAVLDEFLFHCDDCNWFVFENREARRIESDYFKKIQEIGTLCKTEEQLHLRLAESFRSLPGSRVFMTDFMAGFAARRPLCPADTLFDGVTVTPSKRGDVELCFDFGEETCGYFDFNIKADAGVVMDLSAVEYISEKGVIQHVQKFNRNGMRYITKRGVNRFTSVKRRAGRYLFVTLRNQKAPVEIRSVRIIESTAPVKAEGSFACSDRMLTRVWEMSERTLKLCMEDTFTDCPLYEQTLWIGDARNEALYAFTAYGNADVSERSLELGAQSLERLPLVGCQVPSTWDCIIPAWSFLWGIHAWEHYFYCGDIKFLRKLWPAVQENMDRALKMLDSTGLFCGKFWNLIEWAPIDQDQLVVLHNSMLLVGALHAAERCAEVLGDRSSGNRFSAARRKLIKAIDRTWDKESGSYPDSIHEDGKPSSGICQHTSMFSVMFDIGSKDKKEVFRENLLIPPPGMTRIFSPFVMQFLYEALEKLGEQDAILNSIRSGFEPMVNAGSGTVWETFAGSTFSPDGFPTRSHCHAWASSPIFFLNRIVLGIRQTEAGGTAFEICPWVGDLKWAKGATATPKGPVSVEWRIKGKTLLVSVRVPRWVKAEFKPNVSHKGLNVKTVWL